jgi:5-methylcytosine-specific restriction endonuclease McrA
MVYWRKNPGTAETARGMIQEVTLDAFDDTTTPLKTCTKCGQDKPRAEFSRQASKKDGRRSCCKECTADRNAGYNATYRASHHEEQAVYRRQHREERAIYNAAWHVAHHEERAVYDSAYYAAHREWKAARDIAYNAAHSEERAAWRVAYNLKHRADKAAYYLAHTEEYAAYCRAHRAAHPESVAAGNHNRKARKLGNGGSHTAEDIQSQYDRQGGKCFYCHEALGRYHVDHVIPLSKGGSNGPENLVIACPACNLSKGAKHPMDFCGRLL